ncbi:hypothetical protein DFH11DRAFT_1732700 [Phellopilus nigrolimitatus]|nr:hypothetical protein DFH11DRAFT_1732700 [Phellopilus nigrolimitatus]
MSFDGPPSYESVVARFEQSLGTNPKPQDVLNAIDQLPQYEVDVLASNALEMPALTDEQKAAFTLGVAKTMSSPEAVEKLKIDAGNASAACKAIEIMFTNLTVELAKIDAKNIPPKEGPFVSRFEPLYQKFLLIVNTSTDLAVKIAIYGEQFESVIIPFCDDESQSTEERLEIITQFINDAETFSEGSNAITTGLTELKLEFISFLGSFSNWASDKETADTKEVKQLQEKLIVLKGDIFKLTETLDKFAFSVTASLAVLGAGVLLASTFLGPFAIIGGLLFLGISLASMVQYAISIILKRNEVSATQARIDDLVKSISDIKATRKELEQLGTEKLKLFNNNITVIGLFWKNAHNDALAIKVWLEGGAKFANKPLYMEKSVNEAVRIYSTMAIYLRQYADGIESVNIPKPTFR